MSDNHESVADIVAEMRYGTIPKHRTDHELLALFADRIEAAHAREVQHALDHATAHAEKVAAANCRDCVLRDTNAAKMREALEKIAIRSAASRDFDPVAEIDYIHDIAESALAAPARNCDVGSAEEQADRYEAFCAKYFAKDENINNVVCGSCPLASQASLCKFSWAQMPYEEGDK